MRFCKYLLLAVIGLVGLLLLAVRNSLVQEFCLKVALENHFKDVQFKGFRGGASGIAAERIELKNEHEAFVLSDLKLNWKPWQLLFKRTLYVKNLQFQLAIDLQQLPAGSTVQTAGVSLPQTEPTAFGFLQPLQLPVKLHLDRADIKLKGHLPNCELRELQIGIRDLTPNGTGVLEYALSAETPLQRTALGVRTQGTLKIRTDAKGAFEAFFLNGKLHLKNGDKEIPAVTYDGSVLQAQPYPKERLQLTVRCGQANEITLSGETLQTADHWVDFKVQVLFDHTLPRLFDIPGIPTLSVLSEGTFGLHRKTNRWIHRLHASVWAKDFDTKTKTLPTLSLKAQLEAESDARRIDLKQYGLQLKEKGTEHLFFTAHSLQPLTYDFKGGLQYASKENAQLLTVACYQVPLEIFNPYLQVYGYRLQSNLDGGQISLAWDEKNRRFLLDTPEPIILKVKNFQKEETPIVSDVHGKLQGHCTVNRDGSDLQYEGKLSVTDAQRMPFFGFSSKGIYQSKSRETEFSSDGTLNFNYRLAQNSLDLSFLPLEIHPNLNIDAAWQLSKESRKNKDTWLIKSFRADIGSAATEQNWISVQFRHPLTIKNDAFVSEGKEPFADIHIQQLPLYIVRHPEVDLRGSLSLDGTLSAQKDALLWQSASGEILTNVKASFKEQPLIELSRAVSGETIGKFHPKDGWSLDVKELQIYTPQQPDPLLKTRFQCRGKEALTATEGQCDVSLDALSLQPFALPYPSLLGTLAGNWKWNEKQKTAHTSLNVACADLPFSADVRANYAQQSDATHVLDGDLELKHADHVNDLSFQQRLDAQNHLSGHVLSKQIFLQDMIGLGAGIQKLVSSLPKKSAPSVSSDTDPLPTDKSIDQPLRGTCDFEFQSISDLGIKDFLGRFDWNSEKLNLELSRGTFCGGSLGGNGAFILPSSDLSCNVSLKNIDLETLWKLPEAFQHPLSSYGQLNGNGSCSLDLTGNVSDLQTLDGRLSVQASDGMFRPKLSTTGMTVSGAATIFGAFTGKILPKAGAVGFLSSYAQSIPFSNLTLNVERSKAEPVAFLANVRNSELAVDLKGSVETRSLTDWKQQPFTCDLQFRAPTDSPFADHFSFNPQKTDKNGYAEGPRCTVDGTLGKPNYLALTQLLSQPSSPASETPENQSQPSEENTLQNLLEAPVKKLFDLF